MSRLAGLALCILLGCAHLPPKQVDTPNWLLWGRKPSGASDGDAALTRPAS